MRLVLTMMVVLLTAGLTACGGRHEEQKRQLRHDLRTRFYDRELKKVQAELARTDSLLRLAQADDDTLNVKKRIRLDSLKLETDVQGAKIRFIHKKQKEME